MPVLIIFCCSFVIILLFYFHRLGKSKNNVALLIYWNNNSFREWRATKVTTGIWIIKNRVSSKMMCRHNLQSNSRPLLSKSFYVLFCSLPKYIALNEENLSTISNFLKVWSLILWPISQIWYKYLVINLKIRKQWRWSFLVFSTCSFPEILLLHILLILVHSEKGQHIVSLKI